MEDELREKIARWLYNRDYDKRHTFVTWEQARDFYRLLADSILSLLAPELAAAEKWGKLMEVYHTETEERFVQFANTISKVRELEGKEEKNERDKNDADALKDAMDDMRQHGDY